MVDAVDCVIVAVLFKQVDEVFGALTFRKEQKVMTLTAGLMPTRLKENVEAVSQLIFVVWYIKMVPQERSNLQVCQLFGSDQTIRDPWKQDCFQCYDSRSLKLISEGAVCSRGSMCQCDSVATSGKEPWVLSKTRFWFKCHS